MKRTITVFVMLIVLCACVLSAQDTEGWRPLAGQATEDITGLRDTAQVDARKLGAGVYVVRTVYQRLRFTSSGKAWQTKYLTATIDCERGTLRVMRMDYYNAHDFVDVLDLPSPPIPVTKLTRMRGEFYDVYAFACGVDGVPPSQSEDQALLTRRPDIDANPTLGLR